MRLQNPNQYKLEDIMVDTGKRHKYIAVLRDQSKTVKVPFGGKKTDGTPYEQFHDSLGFYSSYDHKDQSRRKAWLQRHAHNIHHKYSSAWFSWKYLW